MTLVQKTEPATVEVSVNMSKRCVEIRCVSEGGLSVIGMPEDEARRVSVQLMQCAEALAARAATKP